MISLCSAAVSAYPDRTIMTPEQMMPLTAALLDRDGTLNVGAPEGQYITGPEQLSLLPGAGEAVARLNEAGIPVAVLTNQRGIARGLMSEDDLLAVHRRLVSLLARHQASVQAILFCPHEVGTCACRKPLPGLLCEAAERLVITDLSSAVMIGDSESDVSAGRAAGTRTVRLAPPGTETAAERVDPTLWSAVCGLLRP